ncbi:hypothetical protein CMI47_05690 [Candidatus Pacearchaeota archaeon]|jgi:hypothetical protein|nr:hypothetical protein [Candidatus Pacearchaeota archaeon]
MTDTTKLAERIEALEGERDAWRDTAKQLANRLEHILPMLGPKAREVERMWSSKGIKFMHVDYGPDGAKTSGEDRAQLHLDIADALESAEPITNIDAHIDTLRAQEAHNG